MLHDPGSALAQPSPVLLIQAEAQTLAPDCAGRDVQIEGNHNVVTLAGTCRTLLLKGVANQVALALGRDGAIRVEGGGNRIEYRAAGLPGIVSLGPDNVVLTQGEVAGEGPLALGGSDQSRTADCQGRDVSITGLRSLYVLRGGCRSLAVRGDLLTVQAELVPQAPVVVAGQGNRVGWVLSRPGRGPLVSIQGPASHAERLGALH